MTILRSCALTLGLVLLVACGRSSPVARNAVEPPSNSIGDAPGQLDPEKDAARIEQKREAALPAPTDGLSWRWDPRAQSARFGLPPSGTSFAITCSNGRLVLSRFDAAPQGATATMSFTGNGRAASLRAQSIGDAAKLASFWQATEAPSDRTTAVARVFDGPSRSKSAYRVQRHWWHRRRHCRRKRSGPAAARAPSDARAALNFKSRC